MGITIGPMEDALKSTVIEINPGIRVAAGASFPTANERNMNSGNSIPNIIAPGLT
jgi:hypothetical protein